MWGDGLRGLSVKTERRLNVEARGVKRNEPVYMSKQKEAKMWSECKKSFVSKLNQCATA